MLQPHCMLGRPCWEFPLHLVVTKCQRRPGGGYVFMLCPWATRPPPLGSLSRYHTERPYFEPFRGNEVSFSFSAAGVSEDTQT